MLGVGYIGYGSLAQSHGFSLLETAVSTISIWALPGQLILVEMQAGGAPFVAIVFAVAFSASRFLPMAAGPASPPSPRASRESTRAIGRENLPGSC